MSATEEVQKPTAEQPPAPSKPVKEKKTRAAPKEKKPKAVKTASHPPYFEMIKDALLALNEKSGSSPYAIAKFMEEKHKAVLPANFRKILGLQLKNSATKGKLIKIKASYKLSEPGKKDKAPAVKPAAKKTAAPAAATKKPQRARAKAKAPTAAAGTKRKAEDVKKAAAKKGAKKATPAKAKQPKSIKSPGAKRAKRATAAA